MKDQRLSSVDIVRGLVMVLMAIDHVRVYSGVPAGGAEAGIFLTRWVTHFCAPVFVFLTGTSAYLYGQKVGVGQLTRFLLSRGLLLIMLEFTLIRFCWTFNLNYSQFVLFGVIWMIGACMVLLVAFIRLRPSVVAGIGIAIMAFQMVFAKIPEWLPVSALAAWWPFIYPSTVLQAPEGVTILYVLVPWIGVMAAGFGFGALLTTEEAERRRWLVWIGLAATVAYFFGSLITWWVSEQAEAQPELPVIFQLMNQRKYPASPLFLLMALGPAILLMAFTEQARSAVARALQIFGRVPMFYYLLHIPLIHLTAVAVNLIREGRTFGEWYATAPYVWFAEDGHQWPLMLLYAVFVLDVLILYYLCRWYERYKFSHPEKIWLRWI